MGSYTFGRYTQSGRWRSRSKIMPTTIATTVRHITDAVPNAVNSMLIKGFHEYMKGNDTSERHQNNTLKVMIAYARYLGPSTTFYQIRNRNSITSFLDTKVKSVQEDPEKRWITTWNHYLVHIKYFFRWLHNTKVKHEEEILAGSPSDWQTPPFAKIQKKKTKRLSPYSDSDIWDLEELKIIIKYERNKAAIALMWDLNARNHEVTLLKIKHIRLRERYGEGEIPHQAKTGSGPILLTFSFPYVRDWLNEHPFRNTAEARLLCNLNNGAPIKPEALWTMMNQLRLRIRRLVETGSITDDTEREKLKVLLNTKKFNPYCLRHSSISHDSDYLPDYALRKKVRWSMNSKQPSRYIKARMGNDLKEKILLENGIISDSHTHKNQSILLCHRCNFANAIECKYCSRCSYILTGKGFEEIKEQENSKFKSLEEKFNAMHSMMEKLLEGLSKETNQQHINIMAQSMFSSGMLKGIATADKKRL